MVIKMLDKLEDEWISKVRISTKSRKYKERTKQNKKEEEEEPTDLKNSCEIKVQQ